MVEECTGSRRVLPYLPVTMIVFLPGSRLVVSRARASPILIPARSRNSLDHRVAGVVIDF
jgi:hypothetical protein